MNKKLLAVAIGAALSTGPLLAQADVKVGGMAQVEIASEDKTTTTAGVSTDTHTVTTEDNSRGRFWIDADEDLGNGMKGLAHFEFRVDTTGVCALETGGAACVANSANTREKYVGLKTNFGTLKLGSVQAPYKYAGGVKWDAFVTTNLEARGNGGMTSGVFGHNNFFDNAVAYTSPNFAGVTFGLTYSFDDVNTDVPTGQSVTVDDGDYSAAVEWQSNFGLHLIGAYNHNANNALGGGLETNSTKLGAKFTFAKNFSVIGQYEMIEDNGFVPASTIDDKVLFLAFHATFGPVLAAIQYGKTEEGGTGTNRDIDYLALGAFYNFSKTFNVFTGYRVTQATQTLPAAANEVEDKVFTVGMRKIF